MSTLPISAMPAAVFPATLSVPLGHYAPAVVHGGLVYISGTLPTGLAVQSPFPLQIQQLLHNLAMVLVACESSAREVVALTLYVNDLAHWDEANLHLAAFFGEHRPARTVLYAPQIREGYAVQASLIASTKGVAR